jgi:hypothetical protein
MCNDSLILYNVIFSSSSSSSSCSGRIRFDSCFCYFFLILLSFLLTQKKYQQDATCNRIYYSKVYWRLNIFRAPHRSSSGALNCICSLWFIYTYGDRPFTSQPWQQPVTTWVYKPEAAYTVFELLIMNDVPLETCWDFNKLWNNKFCFKAASCWYFYWVILRCMNP